MQESIQEIRSRVYKRNLSIETVTASQRFLRANNKLVESKGVFNYSSLRLIIHGGELYELLGDFQSTIQPTRIALSKRNILRGAIIL